MPAQVAESDPVDPPFAVKDCALIAIATGRRASGLKELREVLLDISTDAIYYHFWGSLIQPRFEEREYNNDFARFLHHGLHDAVLAERLAMLDPTDFADIEDLRRELIELIDQRLDEAIYLPWIRSLEAFEFIRSQIVVFDTGRRISRAEELVDLTPTLSATSVFYHFIDARRRVESGADDFRHWLAGFNDLHAPLIEQLASIDPFFMNLSELREKLAGVFAGYFGSLSI